MLSSFTEFAIVFPFAARFQCSEAIERAVDGCLAECRHRASAESAEAMCVLEQALRDCRFREIERFHHGDSAPNDFVDPVPLPFECVRIRFQHGAA